MPKGIQYAAVVVGSGPSGIAAATALIKQGIRPLILDVGLLPEKDAFEMQIKSQKTESRYLNNEGANEKNPAEKTWFGSTSPYRQDQRSNLKFDKEVIARPSFGLGGMSRVWGATFDFYEDFTDWPNDCIPTRNDFEAVKSLVPHSTTTFESDTSPGCVLGHIASEKLFRKLSRLKNFDLKLSTLAIETKLNSPRNCKSCSGCLTGCPYDSIWNSSQELQDLVMTGKAEYLPDSYVDQITESEIGVKISVVGSNKELRTFVTERVFLACGPISTAHLFIKSNIVEKITFKDTATIFTGIFAPFTRSYRESKSHSLSQFWISSKAKNVFMAQIYPPSSDHVDRVIAALPLKKLLKLPVKLLISRVHPVIAYLSTDISDTFTIEKKNDTILVSSVETIAYKKLARRQLKNLSRPLLSRLSVLVVRFAKISTPGTGYHFGSSLQHGLLTDSFGRPSNFQRIHVVDASVLPSIFPGSITPTVMANAMRIVRSFYESCN